MFDYQSVCHCSKTLLLLMRLAISLTTSQFVTAPKRSARVFQASAGLTTSQFVTAPKLQSGVTRTTESLTTSQFVTAPKP